MPRNSSFPSPLADEAMAWHVRLPEAGADTWAAFIAWLEASPEHSRVYDEVSLADAEIGDLFATPQPVMAMRPVNDNTPGWRRQIARAVPAMTALAAALVAAVVLDPLSLRHAPYTIETAAGETRTVTLEGGTRLTLNGGTAVGLDRRDARTATLERGQVALNVVHDAAHPFALQVGGSVLQDVGTEFDVTRADGRTRVAVAEGSVLYNPKAEGMVLKAGDTLVEADGRVTTGSAEPSTVGSWRSGRLVYRAAAIGEVVADVARATGMRLDVTPDLAQRPFSGVIMVDANRSLMIERLRAVLAVDARQTAGGWTITSRGRAAD